MSTSTSATPVPSAELQSVVSEIVQRTPVFDIHTHLYPPAFRQYSLWGIDELVNYHYLIAETFRFSTITVDEFWALDKREQADVIWNTLFVNNTPVSEACRGVVNVLSAFGLKPNAKNLDDARKFFAARTPEQHVADVLKIANVTDVVMTNDIFDKTEAAWWLEDHPALPQYHAVLRMDPLLNDWAGAAKILSERGYRAGDQLDEPSISAARRFLSDWVARLKPLYMAASLPPSFRYPEDSSRGQVIEKVVLPSCREHNIPFSMMIGARKRVNPALRDAGDSLGNSDTSSVERICLHNPENRFLVSMLSRENQHELCVAARKFRNLMPFGCWWFLNNPSIIAEITDERLELLGTSFIPQHSDARILDQLIYKWDHSRRLIAESLTRAYAALVRDGWVLTEDQIARDVAGLFQDNFRRFVGLPAWSEAKAATRN
jgi:hypothetical protein